MTILGTAPSTQPYQDPLANAMAYSMGAQLVGGGLIDLYFADEMGFIQQPWLLPASGGLACWGYCGWIIT